MALNHLFAIRGFIAFVAFIELVNAVRSITSGLFVDREDVLKVSFVRNKIFTGANLSVSADLIIAQLFGIYSLLNSSILLASAVFVHYKPVVFLAILALVFKSLFYIFQGFVNKTIPLTAGFQVPLLITFSALLGLLSLPWILQDDRKYDSMRSENEDLLRKLNFPRSKRQKNL